MKRDIESVLFTQEQIAGKIRELAEAITGDYEDKNPIFIGVLKGSFMFMADLIREIPIHCEIDFMSVSSYGNKSETTGAVKILSDLTRDIENRHIIVVEDILDSGLTLNYLVNYLNMRKPASVRLCTFLDKPGRRRVELSADYIGFTIPDGFVVGYGLDFAERYRNLPFIGILNPSVYE